MGRIMAIDYGTKRIGLAVTDPLNIIATALETVATAEIFKYLKNYCLKETVDCFVLGYPSNSDGTPTDSTPHVLKFHKELQKHFAQIPIEFYDERYTSKIARQAMLAGGMKKKR